MMYPIATEKALGAISKLNTIVFVVDKSATRASIKKEVEADFAVKVSSVRMLNAFNGQKRAYVRLSKESNAMDLASKLKIL
jgi:large subunit ribosomal protein L23Ae